MSMGVRTVCLSGRAKGGGADASVLHVGWWVGGYLWVSHVSFACQEEKEELEQQLEKLQAELLGLKYRAMFPHLSAARKDGASGVNPHSAGDVLRDAVKVQQLSLARVQAMLSGYVVRQQEVRTLTPTRHLILILILGYQQRQHRVSPIQTPILLGRDPVQRRATLQALKDGKVAEATRFLTERTRGLDRTKAFFEEERFETDAGDFCVVQCDITPLPKARNVKELFDVLFYFIFNVEIKITETLGSITVREDDESGDEGVSHHRLASRTQFGVPTEISTVHFSDFHEPSAENLFLGSGTIVADFVDEDELYPYRPRERVRRDLTAVLTITPERRRKQRRPNAHNPNENGTHNDNDDSDDDGVVVVLTRWMTIRSHRPQFPVSDEAALHLQSTLGGWTDEVVKALRLKAAADVRTGHLRPTG